MDFQRKKVGNKLLWTYIFFCANKAYEQLLVQAGAFFKKKKKL